MKVDKQLPQPPRAPSALAGATVGYATLFLMVGVFGGWAAVTPLASAVSASGRVVVETARKTVQHLEGGIVAAIEVGEHQHVAAGQVLMRLVPLAAEANADFARRQVSAARVRQARLAAERERRDTIVLPDDLQKQAGDSVLAAAIADEQRQFAERRALIASQVAVLEARRSQLEADRIGTIAVKAASESRLESLTQEIDRITPLIDNGFYPLNRLAARQREATELKGRIDEIAASLTRAEKSIEETNLQIDQVWRRAVENIAGEEVELAARIAEYTARQTVADDVLTRMLVRAPVAGVVQNLKVHSLGAVVRPGEPILDVVPTSDDLVVEARVSPSDVLFVQLGAEADVKFVSSGLRLLPSIHGTVETISADALVDERDPRQTYYSLRVRVPPANLPPALVGRIMPGMYVETMVKTGERTVAAYLLDPVADMAWRGFREH
jgi:HlyD family type I secretion membrane fusion protein